MHKSADLKAPAPQQEKGSPRVSLTSLGLVLFSVIAAASGQLLLKYGMQHATARAQRLMHQRIGKRRFKHKFRRPAPMTRS